MIYNILCGFQRSGVFSESSPSNNVGPASNMRPCFPASNGTDVHHCDTVTLHQIVPRHLILQRIVLLIIFPKSEPGQLQKNYDTACLEIKKGYYLRNSDKRECSCYSLSQDD